MWANTVRVTLSLAILVVGIRAQEESTSTSTEGVSSSSGTTTELPEAYDPNQSYCFEFTWLGPAYDQSSKFEQNCEEFLQTNNVQKFIPCRQPLVITNDSTRPNMGYLWTTYKPRVVRRLRKGEVCAKYAFSFNNELINVTYMRTKVFAENEGPVVSGCYTHEKHGGNEVELCICQPMVGDVIPCNGSGASMLTFCAVLLLLAILLPRNYLT